MLHKHLAILGQLDPDRAQPETGGPRPEQVTLASGRPLLVVPYAGRFEQVGRRVVIGWNAMREAARAVNGADLLVMGAYGHSRLRELLLGGATRTLLGNMTIRY